MKRLTVLRRIAFGAAIIALSPVTASSALANTRYFPAWVLYALSHPHPRLKIITSHRGQYGPQCPENSICAIRAAADADIESVEIDVKESKDGTLWPFHDMTVGRTTNYSHNGRYYNPFISGVDNSLANPAVERLTDQQLHQLKLRDLDGHLTGWHATDLRTMLDVINKNVQNMTVILDIKTPTAVGTAARLVRELGMGSSVVLKFGIGLFTPDQLRPITQGVRFAPTLYAGDMDRIRISHPNGGADAAVANYVKEYKKLDGWTYLELGAKEFHGSGNTVGLSGSMAGIAFQVRYSGVALGNFAPVLEKKPNAASPRTGYYRSDGSCCASLNDYLTKTKYYGNETRDDRPDIAAQVAFFNNILTDNGAEALRIARATGGRADVNKIIH